MSVSFSGESAFELHVPNAQLHTVYTILIEAGEAFGLAEFGLYATESMRLEKGYRHWKSDLITEYTPFETGLDRFVKLDKTHYEHHAALKAATDRALRRRLVTLTVNCDSATAHPGDSIYAGSEVVGTVSSAAWGFRVEKNIATGFVNTAHTTLGTDLHVDILGKRWPARVVEDVLYDPENLRIREPG